METAPPANVAEAEGALARRAAAGDEAAFEDLVVKYSRPILDYCRRLVGDVAFAEDLAQETFVKFYLALPTFDPSKAVSPFLYRIAHNHCLDWLRKKKVPTVPLVWKDEAGEGLREVDAPDLTLAPDELVERAEVREAVDEALASLPPTYRGALIMRHREGMSYEEIAEVLELPLGTVKARIHRGREKLQQKLAKYV
ncbi:MAG: sigma-70 family RNA polymerase sigma factor [candidate division Zixibacteria bacterium]|nr:sigma-70 family RNA polymerase sigma factor [candidate division Zixibacteria bacterium]